MDSKLRRMDSDHPWVSNNVDGMRTIEETMERLIFAGKILGPLLGQQLITPSHVYHIDLEEIDEIERALESIRPAHRKHKRLASVCHLVVLADCTQLPKPMPPSVSTEPVYCIELKPKQGFLTKGHQHCPFCLNQFLKRKHGKIQRLSQYCPLDLFSGEWPRMLKALLALTKTPQNNLRIFQDGNLVFAEECQTNLTKILKEWFHDAATPDESLPMENLCTLVIKSLLQKVAYDDDAVHPSGEDTLVDDEVEISRANVDNWFNAINEQKKRNHLDACQATTRTTRLPADCVLSKVLHVQSLGDVDFGRLYAAYDRLVDCFRDQSFSYENLRWTHPQMTAQWLDDVQTKHVLPHVDVTLQESVRLVQRYRISSTSRDCSIMITFQRIKQQDADLSTNVVCDLSGHVYAYHASIVDLDPKPVSCVEKHRRRNQAMNEAFLLDTQSASASPSHYE